MEYSEFEKFVCDQYRDIFKNDYNEEYAKKSAQKIWDSVDDKKTAMDAAKAVVEKTRKNYEEKAKMFDVLSSIKDELFDAPVEVKEAFNKVVNFFDIDE